MALTDLIDEPESTSIGTPILDPDTEKVKGREVEFLAAAELTKRGYLVSMPSKTTTYDLIVSSVEDIYRVEVKKCDYKVEDDSGNEYHRISIRKNKLETVSEGRLETIREESDSTGTDYIRKRGSIEREKTDFDFLIVLTRPDMNWWIIPSEGIEAKHGIFLRPGGKYGRYIDAW